MVWRMLMRLVTAFDRVLCSIVGVCEKGGQNSLTGSDTADQSPRSGSDCEEQLFLWWLIVARMMGGVAMHSLSHLALRLSLVVRGGGGQHHSSILGRENKE